MSNESKTPPTKGIRIAHLYFVSAFDFPGAQETHIPCGAEPKTTGTSYVASYVPELGAFELRIYQGGNLAGERMIPREQVKQYTRAA